MTLNQNSQTFLSIFTILFLSPSVPACQFHGEHASGKFSRVREDLPLGSEIFRVSAHPRQHFNIQTLDGARADGYFAFREVDRHRVAIVLQRSLQELVDQSAPTNSLQFRLACRGQDGVRERSYLWCYSIFLTQWHTLVILCDG